MSRKSSFVPKDSKPVRADRTNNGVVSARSKPRVSPVFHVARLVLINAMAKARVPTEEIAAKLGVNRSYVIRQCSMSTVPTNPSERAIAKAAAEHEGHFRKLGLHGLLGEGFTTVLAGDPEREDRVRAGKVVGPVASAKSPKSPKSPKSDRPGKPDRHAIVARPLPRRKRRKVTLTAAVPVEPLDSGVPQAMVSADELLDRAESED
jgi:hypothetical protein